MKLLKLKVFLINKISIYIAENNVNCPSDYKEEIMNLNDLKSVLEVSNWAWIGVNWMLNVSSPLAFLEKSEDLAEYARILVDICKEEVKEGKKISQNLSKEKSKNKSLQDRLLSEKRKIADLELEKKKLKEFEQQVVSLFFSKNAKNILESEIKNLVADLEDEENLNIGNYSHDIEKELRTIERKCDLNSMSHAIKELDQKTDQISREQNKFYDKLLTEKQESYGDKYIIQAILLIGLLIIFTFLIKKKRRCVRAA